MDADDLEAVLAGGFARLREAEATVAPAGAGATKGKDPDGYVEVEVDGHGLLTNIVFADDIDELQPEELESAALAAIQDALRNTGRPRARDLPDIGDSEVSAKARWVLGMEND